MNLKVNLKEKLKVNLKVNLKVHLHSDFRTNASFFGFRNSFQKCERFM